MKIGDRVRFINERGEGIVKKITKDTVHVMIEDGFEVPYMKKEVFVIENKRDEENIKNEAPKNKNEKVSDKRIELSEIDLTDPSNTQINVLLGFVPVTPANISVSNIDLYLINDTNYGLHYVISEERSENNVLIAHGTIEDNTKELLRTFSQSTLSQAGNLVIQVLFFGSSEFLMVDPMSAIISTREYDFYRAREYRENEFFDQDAIIVDTRLQQMKESLKNLSESDIEKSKKEKDVSLRIKKASKLELKPELEEVDLHIHEILDEYKHLTNGEILEIQMARFETTLLGAINSNQNRIVYIHGVGNGKLKFELRKTLDTKYSHIKYQDASFKEYGFGATMVILK